MRRERPVRRTSAASRTRRGISIDFRKSPPVPLGKIPSSASLPEIKMPFATSEIVPSPPQATISLTPLQAAAAASSIPSPACVVNTGVKEPKWDRRSLAIPGQASPVAPPADAGLMMTSGRDMEIDVDVQSPLSKVQSLSLAKQTLDIGRLDVGQRLTTNN